MNFKELKKTSEPVCDIQFVQLLNKFRSQVEPNETRRAYDLGNYFLTKLKKKKKKSKVTF